MIAANPDATDNGRMTQANSITAPCVRHYLSCEETGGTINTLTDIKKATVMLDKTNPAHSGGVTIEAGATNSVRVAAWTSAGRATEAAWDAPGNLDYLALACCKSRIDSGSSDTWDGGCVSLYIGKEHQIKIHPYFAAFVSSGGIGSGKQAPTLTQNDLMRRPDGQNYVVGALRRGGTLGHWVDSVLRDLQETRDKCVAQDALESTGPGPTDHTDYWDDFTPEQFIGLSHSAYNATPYLCPDNASPGSVECGEYLSAFPTIPVNYHHFMSVRSSGKSEHAQGSWIAGDGNAGSITEFAQDYFGILFCIFTDGAPSDAVIKEAMGFIAEEWPADNKVIPPCLVSLP